MDEQIFTNLSGKMLIATPYAMYGDVFYKSLIYVLSHTKDGSAGLIVNQLMSKMPMRSILNIVNSEAQIEDSENLSLSVYLGGPIEMEKGFFIHSGDYEKNLLFKPHDNQIAISSNIEILKDIAAGVGPKNSLFIVGYTGWAPRQLESEMEKNLWLVSECNPSLIFAESNENKWDMALHSIGINHHNFVIRAGNC